MMMATVNNSMPTMPTIRTKIKATMTSTTMVNNNNNIMEKAIMTRGMLRLKLRR